MRLLPMNMYVLHNFATLVVLMSFGDAVWGVSDSQRRHFVHEFV